MDAVEILKERNRLTKNCNIDCCDCRLSDIQNDAKLQCGFFQKQHPQKYVEIIERWSKDCPKQTYLSKLLEIFPNTELEYGGTPFNICPSKLGLKDLYCNNKCIDCWNQEWEA